MSLLWDVIADNLLIYLFFYLFILFLFYFFYFFIIFYFFLIYFLSYVWNNFPFLSEDLPIKNKKKMLQDSYSSYVYSKKLTLWSQTTYNPLILLARIRNYIHTNSSITKTCLYNFDPLRPHFYIVKLGFTGVYIIFLIFAQNIDCGYSLEPPRRGGSNEYPQSMLWGEIWKISDFFFYLKIFIFLVVKFSVCLNRYVFVMLDWLPS